MVTNGRLLVFLMGMFCGGVLAAALGHVPVFWISSENRSSRDAALYDGCLVTRNGNTVVCEVLMREINREQVAEAAMKVEAAEMLATGASKRQVVEWAMKHGFVGRQLSDAAGIYLEDLQHGEY
jgi:hypothetical protein